MSEIPEVPELPEGPPIVCDKCGASIAEKAEEPKGVVIHECDKGEWHHFALPETLLPIMAEEIFSGEPVPEELVEPPYEEHARRAVAKWLQDEEQPEGGEKEQEFLVYLLRTYVVHKMAYADVFADEMVQQRLDTIKMLMKAKEN